MKDFAKALSATVELLKKSDNSIFTRHTCNDIIEILEENINELTINGKYQKSTLGLLFAPTGAIQEISIDNGWGDEYFKLSTIVDTYTK